jgi:uncharacterized LabA/DUF88 family protein
MQPRQIQGDVIPCHLYIDAQNIRIALKERDVSDEFDPGKLRGLVEAEAVGGRQFVVMRVFVYNTSNNHADEAAQKRERAYLDRLEQLPDVHVVDGTIGGAGRQKGVDVRLAVDALSDAWTGRVGAIAIASCDGDFAPLADAVRRAGPHVIVLAFEKSLSRDLRDAADRTILLPEKPDGWTLKG